MISAMARRHNEIRRMRESYTREKTPHRFVNAMAELFADRSVNLGDFSIRKLFEACVDDGYELVQNHFDPSGGGGVRLLEATGAVNTAMFAATQGQYLYNAILRSYQMPELIGDMLVTVINSKESGEKIPGVSEIGDEVEVVGEGKPYPTAAVAENWIQTPETIKRGLMINLTKEVIFFDKTGQILQRAANIGRTIAINREKRILDVALGISTVYSRNGAAVEATYGSDNTSTSNPLVDWTSVDTADTKFSEITDPDTGEPIVITANTMVVPFSKGNTARRILNATMTNSTYRPNAAAGTPNTDRETRLNGNGLNQSFNILSNQYVKQRTSSDTTWFYGNPKEAFVYMQNWPLTVEQEGENGHLAFSNDIVARFKASERGAAGVLERRYMLKATA